MKRTHLEKLGKISKHKHFKVPLLQQRVHTLWKGITLLTHRETLPPRVKQSQRNIL